MTDTMPLELDEDEKQRLAQLLVEQAKRQGVDLLGPGGLLTGLTRRSSRPPWTRTHYAVRGVRCRRRPSRDAAFAGRTGRNDRQDVAVRIGTWNLAGRGSEDHRIVLEDLHCDMLLLTEVSDRVDLSGMVGHITAGHMARRRHWSGIWSRHGLTPLHDPHERPRWPR